MKGIIQPNRGRPGKVTKSIAPTPRGRPVRRGPSDPLPNQDPDLENHDLAASVVDDHSAHEPHDDHDDHDDHHHHHHQHPDHHHANYDPGAAAAAAAAAAHQHQQQQLDLTAASILASSVQNPNDQQHPDLAGPMDDGDIGPHSTESFAKQSGYENVVVESALAKRLAREPGMRLAQQRRPEQMLNLARRSNVEALFAHIAGEMASAPCKNCHKGHGPWNTCVVVDGQMCGSCANCWFNASGARCSFHETRNPAQHGQQVLAADPIGFQMAPAPPAAMAPFNFASVPASADPVVRYTVEQAMAQVRGADKKTRQMLMIEASARQLAYQIMQYEGVDEDQNNGGQQGPPQAVMNDQDAP
ncbi:hypothetical protein F4778DRAFT_766081 [Xylariomycetidae sp. FL2044]|nr:hypothetical protein F4778DRAFT_766081 [Xylariomycetidae sp. FL2044]